MRNGTRLVDLLDQGDYPERVAVAVNRRVIPRGEYARYRLAPGDEVDIVQAVDGG
ncbi:MAG: sulfur carrier protein ThiS [Ectothiorhodospiraceae bacterium]|nr:sulfur carrier protein ThiS [Ectothiorhodospiraceae bacterium]